MTMDHELKQRLIGAVVVTALCAIFIPMLFDDPVETSSQTVSELSIPAPAESGASVADKLPASTEQVLNAPSSEVIEDSGDRAMAVDETMQEPDAEDTLYAESDGYGRGGAAEKEPDYRNPSPVSEPVRQEPIPNVAPSTPPKIARNTVKPDVTEQVQHSAPSLGVTSKVDKIVAAMSPPVKKIENKPSASTDNVHAAASPKAPNTAKALASAVAEAVKPAKDNKPKKITRWYIQLGSFSKKDNALALWSSLRDQGVPASLDTVQTDKGVTYRLRVGPELDGKKAAAMKATLNRKNISAILVSE